MKKDHIFLPAVVIDTHCHPRDLDQDYKTTIYKTMFEAMLSGIGISFFMPNTKPSITDIPTLEYCIQKSKAAQEELQTPFGQKFFFGLTDLNLAGCEKALQYDEVVGLKRYPMSLQGKTVTTGTIGSMHKKTKLAALKMVHACDKVFAEHCSNPAINQIEGDSIRAVVTDIRETIELAELVPGVKITICHVADMYSANLILGAQKKGLKIAIEICPHYLTFSGDGFRWNKKIDPVFYWCFNNLRSKMHLDFLDLLVSTSFDNRLIFIGSDHAPHTRQEKIESAKIGKPIGGLPSNRHLLPTMIGKAKLHSWSYEHLARLISWNASDFYGIKVPKELARYTIELKKDDGAYNHGIIENPWSHLKMWYPLGKE
jgi:dihydroorotase-like cyclic amidohydrolase